MELKGTMNQADSNWQRLPDKEALFILPVRLAMTTVNPCRAAALELQPGQPLRLRLQPDNPRDPSAVCMVTAENRIAGYLYAETAAWMAMLLQYLPGWQDESVVMSVQKTADKQNPAQKNKRFPVVIARIELLMPIAWPLYTIAAITGFPMADFLKAFNIAGNEWLCPLISGYNEYRRLGFDRFSMPAELVRAWRSLSQNIRIS